MMISPRNTRMDAKEEKSMVIGHMIKANTDMHRANEETAGTRSLCISLFPLLSPVDFFSRLFACFAGLIFLNHCLAAEPLRIDSVVLRPMVEAEVPARQ